MQNTSQTERDELVAAAVESAVFAAAQEIKRLFSFDSRPSGRDDIVSRIAHNDDVSMGILRERLARALPSARIVEDEMAIGRLPEGEWWIIDPVEGAINQIHGMIEWCVTVTLVRDNELILTAVHQGVTGDTYTARTGHGAYHNGKRLNVSAKTEIGSAMVGTGQARPGESVLTYERMGASVTSMMQAALTVRVSVPATIQLIQVAAGRMDGFWQFSQVLSGLASGALLVREAGGVLTDVKGEPWTFDSETFLATSPALNPKMTSVLSQLV